MLSVYPNSVKTTNMSSDDAIIVEGISKRYRIGSSSGQRNDTLREAIMASVTAPWHRLRRLGQDGAEERTNELWALRDVSFRVGRGEAIGIIGRNGAGKSTLLKVLSRITSPTTGRVMLQGRVGSLLEVGTGFHPELTGRENIFLYGAIIGMSRSEIRRKFDQIVDFAEVDRFIDTPVKRYSSGMYVRLAFAVAAHMEPEILLIDEVLSVGDLAFQRKCMEHAKRLQERDATLLFVSHSMFSIKAFCDRCVYIAGGQIRFDGPTDEAIRRYDQEGGMDMSPWAQEMVGTDPLKCPIHIRKVETLSQRDEPRTMYDFGERIKVRLHFEARDTLSHPNFTVSFVRSDDVSCCCYSTALDGFATNTVSGSGIVELLTPPIKLVSDLYSIQVLVWDHTFQRLYCAQVATNIHIRHDQLSTQFGVFHEDAEWNWKRET